MSLADLSPEDLRARATELGFNSDEVLFVGAVEPSNARNMMLQRLNAVCLPYLMPCCHPHPAYFILCCAPFGIYNCIAEANVLAGTLYVVTDKQLIINTQNATGDNSLYIWSGERCAAKCCGMCNEGCSERCARACRDTEGCDEQCECCCPLSTTSMSSGVIELNEIQSIAAASTHGRITAGYEHACAGECRTPCSAACPVSYVVVKLRERHPHAVYGQVNVDIVGYQNNGKRPVRSTKRLAPSRLDILVAKPDTFAQLVERAKAKREGPRQEAMVRG